MRTWEGVAVRTCRRGSSEDMGGCSSEDMAGCSSEDTQEG